MNVMKAIVLRQRGAAETLVLEDIEAPVARANEAVVDVFASGVNFMDIGVRNGLLWKDKALPLCSRSRGRVPSPQSVSGVTDLRPGQRVAWVMAPVDIPKQIALPAASLVPLPDDITDETAAALMMQGITASHFATRFYETKPDDVALVHAAAAASVPLSVRSSSLGEEP